MVSSFEGSLDASLLKLPSLVSTAVQSKKGPVQLAVILAAVAATRNEIIHMYVRTNADKNWKAAQICRSSESDEGSF
jgi:hypothetical protein